MKRTLSNYALVVLAASVFCIGCSKKNSVSQSDLRSDQSVTLVALVTISPDMASNIQSQSVIDPSLSCVQWTKRTSAGQAIEAVEFHHAACANDGTALGDQSMAFSVNVRKASDGSVQLLRNDSETEVVVGQVVVVTDAPNLQELCQFTASGSTPSVFSDKCNVAEKDGSWGSLDVVK